MVNTPAQPALVWFDDVFLDKLRGSSLHQLKLPIMQGNTNADIFGLVAELALNFSAYRNRVLP
jgi:hypothetical protein